LELFALFGTFCPIWKFLLIWNFCLIWNFLPYLKIVALFEYPLFLRSNTSSGQNAEKKRAAVPWFSCF